MKILNFDQYLNEGKSRGDVVFTDEEGKQHFPINTVKQARNALGRANQYKKKPKWFKGKYKGIEIIDANNIDWVDIATDSEGNLVIGDFGNNWSFRHDLCLYVI